MEVFLGDTIVKKYSQLTRWELQHHVTSRRQSRPPAGYDL